MKNFLTNRNNNNNLGFGTFDDFFDDFFRPTFFSNPVREMRTDIKEKDNSYELSVDLPGFDKKDISVSLKNGYLSIEAKREDKEEGENFVRRERSYSCSRSYYVGDLVTEKDVKAKYSNGTLVLDIPKLKEKEIPSGNVEIE